MAHSNRITGRIVFMAFSVVALFAAMLGVDAGVDTPPAVAQTDPPAPNVTVTSGTPAPLPA